ncbi:hypothetical protein EES44_24565 [Streptomyces sp. ADI96-15]|nr:hypothetical protein [Streptomyces albidoflavus]RPK58109.1 hypothetical protein EES44_24565 [Streptomyces sp. ADI96-15]
MAAPMCCGRPMRPDGRQFVCPKCKSWTDSGVALAVGRLAAAGVR